MQDCATAHTLNHSINVSKEVFEDGLISCKLWPARATGLNRCDIYLWGNLKHNLYSQNSLTVDKLKNICETVSFVEVRKL
jgi:hypothetical protein